MSDDTEFRESIKRTIRGHDVGPEELRSLATDLERLAEEWEQMEDTL